MVKKIVERSELPQECKECIAAGKDTNCSKCANAYERYELIEAENLSFQQMLDK